MFRRISTRKIKSFLRDENGVALVEFALFLPLFVLAFFVIVEFSRTFFSYQGALAGVRDATRYLARVAPAGLCQGAVGEDDGNGGTTNPGDFLVIDGTTGAATAAATTIIRRNMDNETGIDLPDQVLLTNVVTTYECVITTPGQYRQDNVPLVRVAATFDVLFPLAGILELNGLEEHRHPPRRIHAGRPRAGSRAEAG